MSEPSVKTCKLARRLITTKANLRKVSHEVGKLLPDLQDWCTCETVSPHLYQIDMAGHRTQVLDAQMDLERAHATLCDLHLILKKICEDENIPIPPDPEPEDGGGR